MNIIAADDERSQLNILIRSIFEAMPDATIYSYIRQSEMFAELEKNMFIPDVAFLDIEMPVKTGLECATVLKKMYPNINIIFVTGFSEYALDAIHLRSSGYVLKPATSKKILLELENLRVPLAQSSSKSIKINCFGSFEIFVNDNPVHFSRAKSKELLAYLVDRRGTNCSPAEIAAVLWDDGIYDRSRQKQYSNIRRALFSDLKKVKADMIIKKTNKALSVDEEKFDCDYYNALNGDVSARNSYTGEYMSLYSWSESTTAFLNDKFF